MTPAEVQAKIEAVVELIASRTMGEPTDDEIRERGEAYAKWLVENEYAVAAKYDHANGEVTATLNPLAACAVLSVEDPK